MTITFI